jgi:uncharacterized caspase-like protein
MKCSVFTFLICLFLSVPTFAATPRVALVIGNSDYAIQPLENPVNDARLMAETLKRVGFEVIHYENLNFRDFSRAVVKFSRTLRAAGDDVVGLVYYAGHAIQANGENYLIPVDADLQDELDLRIQAVDASTLLAGLDSAGNSLNMVILDSCRNNPFKALSRSGTRGMAKLDAPSGTLIAYSTAPGDVAVDGTGKNSPYTKALARAISAPGVPVEQVFKSVRINVMERTGERQVPWESSSLTGDFFFVEKAPEVQVAAVTEGLNNTTADVELWKAVSASNDPALYQSYLDQFPDGLFASVAAVKVQDLQQAQSQANQVNQQAAQQAFFMSIQGSKRVEDFETYLTQWPDGLFAGLARNRVAELQQARAIQMAAVDTNQTTLNTQTDSELELWNSIKYGTTAAEFEVYLNAYPDGKFASAALAKVAALTTATTSSSGFVADGDWKLEMIVGDQAANSKWRAFCLIGDTIAIDVTVQGGKFRYTGESKRGSRMAFQGNISGLGVLTLKGIGQGHKFEAMFESVGGSFHGDYRSYTVGKNCSGNLKMSRVN